MFGFVYVYQAAQHLIDERLADRDNSSADAQAEPSPPSSPQVNTALCAPWYVLCLFQISLSLHLQKKNTRRFFLCPLARFDFYSSTLASI